MTLRMYAQDWIVLNILIMCVCVCVCVCVCEL